MPVPALLRRLHESLDNRFSGALHDCVGSCRRMFAFMDSPHIQVDSEIARAWTLPSAVYADASVFALEKEKIFRRSWQVVGHSSQVASAGDYFTAELDGEPLLFVRGLDGKLRGFY